MPCLCWRRRWPVPIQRRTATSFFSSDILHMRRQENAIIKSALLTTTAKKLGSVRFHHLRESRENLLFWYCAVKPFSFASLFLFTNVSFDTLEDSCIWKAAITIHDGWSGDDRRRGVTSSARLDNRFEKFSQKWICTCPYYNITRAAGSIL